MTTKEERFNSFDNASDLTLPRCRAGACLWLTLSLMTGCTATPLLIADFESDVPFEPPAEQPAGDPDDSLEFSVFDENAQIFVSPENGHFSAVNLGGQQRLFLNHLGRKQVVFRSQACRSGLSRFLIRMDVALISGKRNLSIEFEPNVTGTGVSSQVTRVGGTLRFVGEQVTLDSIQWGEQGMNVATQVVGTLEESELSILSLTMTINTEVSEFALSLTPLLSQPIVVALPPSLSLSCTSGLILDILSQPESGQVGARVMVDDVSIIEFN